MTIWRYEIKHGPEGEANYAWIYKGDLFVATMRTHHAVEIVKALSASPAGVVKPQYIGLKGASEIASTDLASMSAIEPAGVGVETTTPSTHVTGTLRVLREGIKEAEADIAFDADAGNQSDASEYGVSLPYQTAREIASLLQSQVTCDHAPVEDEIARVVQSVNEWDDRTSPDDYPEHLLITSEELADILRNFAAALKGDEQ